MLRDPLVLGACAKVMMSVDFDFHPYWRWNSGGSLTRTHKHVNQGPWKHAAATIGAIFYFNKVSGTARWRITAASGGVPGFLISQCSTRLRHSKQQFCMRWITDRDKMAEVLKPSFEFDHIEAMCAVQREKMP
eukprot:3582259-Amphidinium_carterae.1